MWRCYPAKARTGRRVRALPAYLADDVRRSVAKVALTCRSKTLCGFVLGTAFF